MLSPARFPPRARLRSPLEFKTVLDSGRRVQDPLFTAVVLANSHGHARLGLAISKKAAADAVARNAIKRCVRESFRQRQAQLPAMDIVMLARTGCSTAAGEARRAALERLWTRIAASVERA